MSGEMEARDEEAGHVDEDDDDDDQVEVEELRSPVEWQAGLTVEAGGRETVVTGNVGQDLTAVSGGVEQGDHQGDQGWDTLHSTAVTLFYSQGSNYIRQKKVRTPQVFLLRWRGIL